MATVVHRSDFGGVLRTWRGRRNRSQLDLATEAGVSQRHISFLETGKSRPSREMVMHLGGVLDVPLRDRNAMLVAAGFAPIYPERSIDHPDLAEIRAAIESMLAAHNPFPAYVLNRHWDLVMANDAAVLLLSTLPVKAQALGANMLKLALHPDGLRTVVSEWKSVAVATLRRIEREVDEHPIDTDLRELLDEVRSYPGLPTDAELLEAPAASDVLVPVSIERDGVQLKFFTAISKLVAPGDITLQELMLETLLPADTATREALTAAL